LVNQKNVAKGLTRYDAVFSEEELQQVESRILDEVYKGRQGIMKGESYVNSKSREMLLFGYHYQYYNTMDRVKGVWNGVEVERLPLWATFLIQRLIQAHVIDEHQKPDAVIVNHYPIMGSIPPHIDNNDFCRPIISLRLRADSKLAFGGQFGAKIGEVSPGIKFKVPFPRGSIIKMEGYSANSITHSIEPTDVLTPTTSITFRKVDMTKKRVVTQIEK